LPVPSRCHRCGHDGEDDAQWHQPSDSGPAVRRLRRLASRSLGSVELDRHDRPWQFRWHLTGRQSLYTSTGLAAGFHRDLTDSDARSRKRDRALAAALTGQRPSRISPRNRVSSLPKRSLRCGPGVLLFAGVLVVAGVPGREPEEQGRQVFGNWQVFRNQRGKP
jgi:hypothetical protein